MEFPRNEGILARLGSDRFSAADRALGRAAARGVSNCRAVLVLFVFAGLPIGCGRAPGGAQGESTASSPGPATAEAPARLSSEPLPERAPSGTGPLFEDVSAASTGIDFVPRIPADHELRRLGPTAFVSGGVAMGDVDGNGRLDLFFGSGPGSNRLYLQAAPFQFEDVGEAAGVGGGDAWGTGSAIVDVDGDGHLDIYVCNYDRPNQLFLGSGTGRKFREAASEFGLDLVDASLFPAFADYDRDGDLDLYVLTYRYYREGGRPERPPVGKRDGKPYVLPEFEKFYALRQTGPKSFTVDTCGRPDRLFRNDGDSFRDVTDEAGIQGLGHGLSATWWDYDEDGDVDLYVGNDFTDPDRLYRNNGDGSFSDVIADVMPYTTWSSMGADCADLNGDGRLDFMSADMAATTHYKAKVTMGEMGDRRWFLENAWPRQTMRNCVFLGTGTQRFLEVGFLCGLAKTDWTWAVQLVDFDGDGWTDVFTTNGMTRMTSDADRPVSPTMLIGRTEWDIWKDEEPLEEQNLAYRGRGDLRFDDASREWGLDAVGMSFAAAHGDLDGDGDRDLVVVNLERAPSVYRNRDSRRHRVVIELAGRGRNRAAIGAMVRVRTSSGRRYVRLVQPARGYLASNDTTVTIGLGDETAIDELAVEWPDGARDVFRELAADRRYSIRQGSAPDGAKGRASQGSASRAPLVFERSEELGLRYHHQETPFDDYQRQPLLPAKHSQLGPGIAVGDADGDGRDDVFVGGAAGRPGRLYRAKSIDGALQFSATLPFGDDDGYEDMASLWFDADVDGDLDLLVTSGSSEYAAGDAQLEDRLYLGDGKGSFRRASERFLPPAAESSSVAVAADYDRDGDVDVFVGARLVPGRYPESPRSRLLRNDRSGMADVTDDVAPGLSRVGLVTSALFSDVDDDRDVDLLVTLEWGPVKLFRNEGGRLHDDTRAAGLAERLGWWNSIAGGDIDADGDIDFVVGNAGLNTKYGAPTPGNPSLLFYGEMAGSEAKRLIESHDVDGQLVPYRGRSCSSAAIPELAERFPTYRSFASTPLDGIYSQASLDRAQRFEATELSSGLLLNDGTGRFDWRPLPRLVQAAPLFGTAFEDIDADGDLDILGVQNLYSREPETGLWRGGLGFVLEAEHDPGGVNLRFVPAGESGWVVPGDGKALAVADVDDDGRPDYLATQNDGPLLAFVASARGGGERGLTIRLRGPLGNLVGVGARVVVERRNGGALVREVSAGGGYLAQSSAVQFFPSIRPSEVVRVIVRWPDGESTERATEFGRRIELAHPNADR